MPHESQRSKTEEWMLRFLVSPDSPSWIWSVAVDDALYVRGYNGTDSRWYQAVLRQKAGRILPPA